MSVHNILVAFNGSDSSVSALKYAASIAKNGRELTVKCNFIFCNSDSSGSSSVSET